MSFCVRLHVPEGASPVAQAQAERRFAQTLAEALGGAELVWPVYQAACALLQRHGDPPDPHALTSEEFLLLSQWQAAEAAALSAVFGPHRHLDEGGYELLPREAGA